MKKCGVTFKDGMFSLKRVPRIRAVMVSLHMGKLQSSARATRCNIVSFSGSVRNVILAPKRIKFSLVEFNNWNPKVRMEPGDYTASICVIHYPKKGEQAVQTTSHYTFQLTKAGIKKFLKEARAFEAQCLKEDAGPGPLVLDKTKASTLRNTKPKRGSTSKSLQMVPLTVERKTTTLATIFAALRRSFLHHFG